MALFGAPLAHEDHAVRACYAALRMQETVKRYSEEVRRTHGIEVQIRVGLNSGEVVVRSIGSDLHMDYTAVGQTPLAARMEQLATPGSIRLTADTLRLAEGYVEVRPLGPVPVKGLGAPVEAYEATGAGAVRSRLQAATARGLTRFVGRDTEVEQLRKALEQARAGHGQLVAAVPSPRPLSRSSPRGSCSLRSRKRGRRAAGCGAASDDVSMKRLTNPRAQTRNCAQAGSGVGHFGSLSPPLGGFSAAAAEWNMTTTSGSDCAAPAPTGGSQPVAARRMPTAL